METSQYRGNICALTEQPCTWPVGKCTPQYPKQEVDPWGEPKITLWDNKCTRTYYGECTISLEGGTVYQDPGQSLLDEIGHG